MDLKVEYGADVVIEGQTYALNNVLSFLSKEGTVIRRIYISADGKKKKVFDQVIPCAAPAAPAAQAAPAASLSVPAPGAPTAAKPKPGLKAKEEPAEAPAPEENPAAKTEKRPSFFSKAFGKRKKK